uniref:Uncharacterized protein n=1 Tax=mine drainage metagenome TaxID=410659 RepID=E6QWJ4_9ZZZZ
MGTTFVTALRADEGACAFQALLADNAPLTIRPDRAPMFATGRTGNITFAPTMVADRLRESILKIPREPQAFLPTDRARLGFLVITRTRGAHHPFLHREAGAGHGFATADTVPILGLAGTAGCRCFAAQ